MALKRLPMFYWRPVKFCSYLTESCRKHRLVGLVVMAFASRAEDPGFDSGLSHGDFSRSSHTIDLKIGTPVFTLPGV